ncbi:hypothetical protein ACETU7_25130 [Rhodococcus sp. 3Y1]
MTIWNELAGLDFELTTVDAGGVPTRSLQAGSGDEAVIFLHGTSGHLEAFARILHRTPSLTGFTRSTCSAMVTPASLTTRTRFRATSSIW